MKKITLILFASMGLFFGCSKADLDRVTGANDDNATTTPAPAPAPDTGQGNSGDLGPQIDRAGRPGITTALIGTFTADESAANAVKSQYNTSSLANNAQFVDEIARGVAIYDSLAGQCGDNKLTATSTGSTTYQDFAKLLADDQLYINGEAGNCRNYLGVELGVQASCGGRTPTSDVIDVTYSAVATGKTSGVSDGVRQDDQRHSTTSFPFLAEPQMVTGD